MISCTYMDMDGVLVDFVGGALELHGLPPHLSNEVSGWDMLPAVISEYSGCKVSQDQFWGTIEANSFRFWSNLTWTYWGESLLNAALEAGPVVLMSSPTRDHMSLAGKSAWIERELGPEFLDRYAFTRCKHHMAHPGALLVDDNPENVEAFRSHGGRAFLWPAHWNEKGPLIESDPHRLLAINSVESILSL